MNIQDRFLELLKRIELRASDEKAYKSHRKSIASRLHKAFSAHRVELIGSFKRGTAIRAVSDIDLMLILNVAEAQRGQGWKSSATVLKHVRQQLQDRFWNTAVDVDKQAVVVRFKDNQHPVDVVPAVYQGVDQTNKCAIYRIPDGAGAWMPTSPQAHNKFILAADKRSRGKLKQTVKLIKYWRECRQPPIPLETFHLELLLAHEKVCVGKLDLATCVGKTLTLLKQRDCRALTDPIGIAKFIPTAKTEAKLERVKSATGAWAERAKRARQAEKNGDDKEAVRLWNLVFNDFFPR